MANIKIENIKPELLSYMNELSEDANELNVRGGLLGILASGTGLGLGAAIPLGAGGVELSFEQVLEFLL